jgi:3D (Asp-Asp-Asp) domain-containing protein
VAQLHRPPTSRPTAPHALLALLTLTATIAGAPGCAETRGSSWMATPLPGGDEALLNESTPRPLPPMPRPPSQQPGQGPPAGDAPGGAAASAVSVGGGRELGMFRNTYYNFPSESDYQGSGAQVMNAACKPIASVARGFFEAVCVQGSGRLRDGTTVSFARRDCECADVCPRSGQKICFEPLDRGRFPFGRGAMGTAITPLRTVAVDTAVIPLGTTLYMPDYDGVPSDEHGGKPHDGCFVAQDRGTKVRGNHVDIFTGLERTTALWNKLVPSNQGVRVVLDHPRCQRALGGG